MVKKNDAYSKFRKSLVEESDAKEYMDATLEWDLVAYDELGDIENSHCICGVKIKHRFHFEHKDRDHDVIVGKDCVENFCSDINRAEAFRIVHRILNRKTGHSTQEMIDVSTLNLLLYLVTQ